MYTFIILCIVLFAISGMIFRSRIKQNQFNVYVIIIIGSLIGTTIVNGVVGSKIPYTKVLSIHKSLTKDFKSSYIWDVDTILFQNADIDYDFTVKDSILKDNSIVVNGERFYQKDSSLIKISLSNDTVCSELLIYKYKKLSDSKWITTFGLPSNGKIEYEVLLVNTEDNKKLIEIINEKFYEKSKI